MFAAEQQWCRWPYQVACRVVRLVDHKYLTSYEKQGLAASCLVCITSKCFCLCCTGPAGRKYQPAARTVRMSWITADVLNRNNRLWLNDTEEWIACRRPPTCASCPSSTDLRPDWAASSSSSSSSGLSTSAMDSDGNPIRNSSSTGTRCSWSCRSSSSTATVTPASGANKCHPLLIGKCSAVEHES